MSFTTPYRHSPPLALSVIQFAPNGRFTKFTFGIQSGKQNLGIRKVIYGF